MNTTTTPDATETPDRDAQAKTPGVAHRFYAWRTAILCLGLPVLGLIVYRDQIATPDELGPVLAEKFSRFGGWMTDFAERLPQNGLKIALVVLLIGVLIYVALQTVALIADSRGAGPEKGGLRGGLRVISGRPRVIDPERYADDLLGYGGDALLGPLRLGMAAFPLFGFLGTVIGLSGAIRDLPAAVNDKAKLDPVLQELYVAFDTTFLGLVGAVICLFAVRVAESQLDAMAHARAE